MHRLAILLLAGCAAAGETPPRLAVPAASAPPRCTAAADDPAWSAAAWVDGLPLCEGSPAGDVAPATRVGTLWSAEALHLRFVCTDPEPYSHAAQRDAPLFLGDVVECFVDPVGDGRQYVEVELAPNNTVFDALHLLTAAPEVGADGVFTPRFRRSEFWINASWDMAGLRSATARTADGWIADLALPAAAILRRTGASAFSTGMTLRAHLVRYEAVAQPGAERRRIACSWAPIAHAQPHTSPLRMGTLELR